MKHAIILLNMGGPNNLNEVELFLKNMFNDKRIIGTPKLIRKLISFLITRKRLNEAQKNYKILGGKSPIINHTKQLVESLAKEVDAKVTYAMRYTPPFTETVLNEIKEYDRIFAIPLYPHHSVTTTESSFDMLKKYAKKLGIKKKITTINSYHLNPHYNETMIERIKEALANEDANEYELIFSAHGLPQRVIDKGDLYQKHIEENAAYAADLLNKHNIHFRKVHLAYQSRLGPIEWTRPYLEDKLKEIKNKKVIIYPIAFTIDNSETEFELDIEYREKAEKLGLKTYKVAKAPNAHPMFVEALKNIYSDM